MIYVEGDGYLATKNHGSPAVYYDAVGDINGARLGPFTSAAAAQAAYDIRHAAGQQVPVPFTVRQETFQGVSGWWVVNTKWGTSRSHFQIRILDDPTSGNAADRLRVGDRLADPAYASRAAFVISGGGTRWDLWSSYRSGAYKAHMTTGDYALIPGHPDAQKWNY